MFSLIYVLIGLFLGWFFLPTPTWAKNIMTALVAKVPLLSKLIKTT